MRIPHWAFQQYSTTVIQLCYCHEHPKKHIHTQHITQKRRRFTKTNGHHQHCTLFPTNSPRVLVTSSFQHLRPTQRYYASIYSDSLRTLTFGISPNVFFINSLLVGVPSASAFCACLSCQHPFFYATFCPLHCSLTKDVKPERTVAAVFKLQPWGFIPQFWEGLQSELCRKKPMRLRQSISCFFLVWPVN